MFKMLFGDRKCLRASRDREQPVITSQTHITNTVQIPPKQKPGSNAAGDILLPAEPPFGLRLGATSLYTALPAHYATHPAAQRSTWRIELHGVGPRVAPIGFDILGDVVLGRNAAGAHDADIDFEAYNAGKLGVSRRHAMLRPSSSALFLMDMDSTNGTCHNGAQLPASSVRALRDGDIISLGKLTFRVKLIDGPFRSQSKPAAARPA
jgi:hypothetical protein